jgi:hypothetical protein
MITPALARTGHRAFVGAPLRIALGLLAMAACCAAAPAPEPDPYAPPAAGAPEIQRLVRDARFGEPGADAALLAWLDAHPAAPAATRILGYGVLCNIYGVRSFNAQRAAVCAAEQKAGGTDLDLTMSEGVAGVPSIRAIGSARIALSRNSWGGTSVPVTANGVTVPWFVDTGAEVTVLSRGVANRLHPRPLGRTVTVGTTTADAKGELAVIDLLRIGDAAVENVPVLILPDDNLSVGSGEVIPAILGLPVLDAFGRAAWLDHGATLALGEEAPPVKDAAHRIYWHNDGVGIPLETPLGVMGAHFDSGANVTSLRPPFLALLPAKELENAQMHEVHTGGAGGMVVRHEKQLAALRLNVGGAPIELANVGIEESGADAGRAGMDLVFPAKLFVLDFAHMTMRVELDGK